MNRTPCHDLGTPCPACDVGPFRRNHYFTGKLMLAGDFEDEQLYGIDKLRHHHQRLHGSGVVCGMKVVPHAQLSCQSRFVCVEPGSAIDCCGREIVIREKDCVDITQVPAIRALIDQRDAAAHVLQVCVRYRECPTDDVPVLYDDTGCDDTRCAPNRILESYEIDVLVDPKPTGTCAGSPAFDWHCTVSPGRANRVAVVAGPPSMLYATSADQKTVFQLETEHYKVVATAALPSVGRDLATSPDGKRLYVLTEPQKVVDPQAHPKPLVTIFDISNGLVDHPLGSVAVDQDAARLAVTKDNRLVVLLADQGSVIVSPVSATLEAAAPGSDLVPDSTIKLIGTTQGILRGLVLSNDNTQAFTADAANNQIAVLTIGPGNTIAAGAAILLADVAPSGVALVTSTGADLLAVVSSTTNQLALVDVAGAAVISSVSVAPNSLLDVAVSPDGRWAYLLVQNGGSDLVQAVDLSLLRDQSPAVPTAPFPVGDRSSQIVVSPAGDELYVPFEDAATVQKPGGIAVIEVTQTNCQDILWRSLNGCPTCCDPDCLTLATITGYHAFIANTPTGDSIEALPADPGDAAGHIARIDNTTRRLLPSVESLYELIQCLKLRSGGTNGNDGAPGKDGKDGAPGKDGVNGINGLNGTNGLNGKDGVGLNVGLPKILDIGWQHNAPPIAWNQFFALSTLAKQPTDALLKIWAAGKPLPLLSIWFNQIMSGLDRRTLRVRIEFPLMFRERLMGIYNPVPLDLYGRVIPVNLPPGAVTPHTGEASPFAAVFVPDQQFFVAPTISLLSRAWDAFNMDKSNAAPNELPSVNVRLKGDFVFSPDVSGKYTESRVLDADNIGGRVGLNETRGGVIQGGKNPSGDLAEGGDFESWFFLEPPDKPIAPLQPVELLDVLAGL